MTADDRHPVTRLTPDQRFPVELTSLSTARLLTLDSLVRRQLDHEMLFDQLGAHPVTLERHFELVTELEAREITAATAGHGAPARRGRGQEGRTGPRLRFWLRGRGRRRDGAATQRAARGAGAVTGLRAGSVLPRASRPRE